jgi:hypothetical protein
MPADKIRVVQFLHPGREHQPGKDGFQNWNPLTKSHRRKFLQHLGQHLENIAGKPASDDLHFWAEWEPQSERIRAIDAGREGFPRNIVRPFLVPQRNYSGLHSTDPFVFGDVFYYSHCMMSASLASMARGSIILFGSHKGGAFLLDTVFVVADWIECSSKDCKSVPDVFRKATLEPLYANHADKNGDSSCPPGSRLYRGAMHNGRFNGMFSFFPCRPADESEGFARPAVCDSRFINPRQMRGVGITDCSIEDAAELWRSIAKQVLETRVDGKPLRLGVSAKLPPFGNSKADGSH